MKVDSNKRFWWLCDSVHADVLDTQGQLWPKGISTVMAKQRLTQTAGKMKVGKEANKRTQYHVYIYTHIQRSTDNQTEAYGRQWTRRQIDQIDRQTDNAIGAEQKKYALLSLCLWKTHMWNSVYETYVCLSGWRRKLHGILNAKNGWDVLSLVTVVTYIWRLERMKEL